MKATHPFLVVLLLGTATALSAVGEYNFRVEIDGVNAGQFQSVDGLSIEIEVIEY